MADHPVPIDHLMIGSAETLKAEYRSDMLGGVTVISGEVKAMDMSDWEDTLYRSPVK